MATKKDANLTPFRTGERGKQCELLAKAALDLEAARDRVKKCKETYDRVLVSIQRGGYLNDDQLELPTKGHVDDALDGDEAPLAAAQAQAKKKGNGKDDAHAGK